MACTMARTIIDCTHNMSKLLDHLVELDPADFVDLKDADIPTLLSGQATTADFLRALGSADDVLTEDQRALAQKAFATVTNNKTPVEAQKEALMTLRAPSAVKHLAGMLTQYDWEYVEQAKQIRSYVVAQLLEESRNPDPRIRLSALKLLGNVTEVGAFTERHEIVQQHASADELERAIRAKLAGLLPKKVEIQDVQDKNECADS